MLDILRHWNPLLKQSENNKTVYISNYCPWCKYYNPYGRHFRYNSKIGVVKCYNCGGACKNEEWFIYQIKNKIRHAKIFKHKKFKDKLSIVGDRFEKVIGCETEYEASLPF